MINSLLFFLIKYHVPRNTCTLITSKIFRYMMYSLIPVQAHCFSRAGIKRMPSNALHSNRVIVCVCVCTKRWNK